GLHNKLGGVYLSTKRFELAIDAFERALAIDAESPLAFEGIGRAKLELGDADAALESALTAAELVHHFPKAHLTIGRALNALGDYVGAVEALELCVKQSPKMVDAHRALATAYRGLGESAKAMQADLRVKQVLG
ncbi:MAG: tetratricopeptide repeat protein, partial [Planctomycetota bacterium]